MPAPEISSFGDEAHDAGETGLVIDGGGFGAFPGSAWIFENEDGSGASDQLTIGAWNDIQLTGVEIPASPNNTSGTRYVRVQREDLAWSNALAFTLSVSGTDALNANDVESASEVTAPTIGQTHALLAADVESVSEVSSPALGVADYVLLAEDIESSSEVSAPSLGQVHALLANDVESSSSVSSPVLGSGLPAVRSKRVYVVPPRRRAAAA